MLEFSILTGFSKISHKFVMAIKKIGSRRGEENLLDSERDIFQTSPSRTLKHKKPKHLNAITRSSSILDYKVPRK